MQREMHEDPTVFALRDRGNRLAVLMIRPIAVVAKVVRIWWCRIVRAKRCVSATRSRAIVS